jgi:hypothetical protein
MQRDSERTETINQNKEEDSDDDNLVERGSSNSINMKMKSPAL